MNGVSDGSMDVEYVHCTVRLHVWRFEREEPVHGGVYGAKGHGKDTYVVYDNVWNYSDWSQSPYHFRI